MKTCTKCLLTKTKDSFHKDKLRSDNLFPYCKECRKRPKKERPHRNILEVLSDYTVSDTGCWEWAGVINVDGYGMACYRGVRLRAHRLSLLHKNNLSETSLLVLHHCDNRRCINPEHLYFGTHQDNSSDMMRRGRTNARKGQKSPKSKLTAIQVIEIINDTRGHKFIAIDYAIAKSTVSAIKTGRNWAHLHTAPT